MDDIQIIDLFFSRDEKAIKETASKYGRLCYNIAFHILNDAADSEECTNDTYLSLWNSIPPQRPQSFKAFLCKIARNLSIKKLEYNTAQKRSSHYTVSLSELEETLPDTGYQREVEDSELGRLLNTFLHEEKEDVRNVFIRRYFFHDDIAEIAFRYGFSDSKVKSMLFHTRNKLKKFLTKEGVYL